MVTGFLIVSSCAFLVIHGHWEPSVRICSLVLFIVGRLSACIGTLLDAHRLALVQLNRHLKLTAIVHLVAAERLIHEFKKDKDKKEAVKLLIPIIAKLIPSEQAGPCFPNWKAMDLRIELVVTVSEFKMRATLNDRATTYATHASLPEWRSR
jgi:hypothetical protein